MDIEKIKSDVEYIKSLTDWQIDYNADPDDQSPEDMVAWCNGIIWQKCHDILDELKRGDKK